MAPENASVHRFRPMAKRLTFVLVAVVLFFVLAEVLLRVFDVGVQSGDEGGNKGAFYFSMRRGEHDIDTNLVMGVRIRPLVPGHYRIEEPLAPKAPGTFRLLCLGDSITYGEGVRADETYCSRLQSILAEALAPRPVEAINAGFRGFTSYQGRKLFEQYQEILEPDAVIFYFGANDMTYAPIRQDKDWASVPDWALQLNRRLYTSSLLYRVLRNINVRYLLQTLVHPFNEKARSTPYRMRVSLADFSSNLSKVEELAARSKAKIFVVPPIGKDRDRLVRAAYFLDLDHPGLIALEPALRERLEQGKRLFVDNVHPNPEGHRIIAKLLAEKILAEID